MEPKLEPGPETVLWLHPIQSGLLIFLSSPSQRGSGSLDRQGKTRTEQEFQGWGEGPGGRELRLPTHLGLTPNVLPLPFPTKRHNCWNAPSEQKLLVQRGKGSLPDKGLMRVTVLWPFVQEGSTVEAWAPGHPSQKPGQGAVSSPADSSVPHPVCTLLVTPRQALFSQVIDFIFQ